MNGPETQPLTRRQFLQIAAASLFSIAFKDIHPLYTPVLPINDAVKRIKNHFDTELPMVDYPIFVRIIDETHPLIPEFVDRSVKPYLTNIKTEGKFRTTPNAPVNSESLQAHRLVLGDLTALIDGCWSVHRGIYVKSGYRDFWMQNLAYEKSGNNHALIALPNATQHGNGLTFDFTSTEIHKVVNTNAKFEQTQVGLWLSKNAWKYGFVQSYIDDHHHDGKENEPWHFTYIGRTLASTYHDLRQKGWEGDVFDIQKCYPQIT